MRITKAHIQLTVLTVGALVVAGIWLTPERPSAPKPVASPLSSAQTPSPAVSTPPRPKAVRPTLALDDNAHAFIARSSDLARATLDADIATQEARRRKAKDATASKPSTYVPSVSVIEQPYTPHQTTPSPAIDRVTLGGLFVEGKHAHAYLSFDGAAPVRMRVGQTRHGVQVTHIDAKGVRLTQGRRTRVLEGGL